MRPTIAALLFSMLGFAAAAAAESGFTSSISAADLAAAGLSGLSAEQRARLDALVENYKTRAATPTAPSTAASAPVSTAAPRAAAAPTPAPTSAAELAATRGPNFLERAKARLKAAAAAPSAEPAPIESTIPGKFRGWEPRQIFTLANGDRFQVANNDSYYTPAIENPKVLILPATIAGFWLRFPDLGTQVRVNLLGDE
ncbi:MAG TPA: hypothetical protein VHD62_12890 [Opitutaceae bacterium]|nr:hypothetical protein [Opitutaceae bacterium]